MSISTQWLNHTRDSDSESSQNNTTHSQPAPSRKERRVTDEVSHHFLLIFDTDSESIRCSQIREFNHKFVFVHCTKLRQLFLMHWIHCTLVLCKENVFRKRSKVIGSEWGGSYKCLRIEFHVTRQETEGPTTARTQPLGRYHQMMICIGMKMLSWGSRRDWNTVPVPPDTEGQYDLERLVKCQRSSSYNLTALLSAMLKWLSHSYYTSTHCNFCT